MILKRVDINRGELVVVTIGHKLRGPVHCTVSHITCKKGAFWIFLYGISIDKKIYFDSKIWLSARSGT
jgi:hypothetical protein